ncbi:hypothetical protein ABZ357_15515 [Streptomyces sp. NPDC005917]|uniref:hypothetical protein n=1 Tax=unclassified Streptomyces TaxID=2593676 RepID=UPI00340E77AE
MCRRTASLRREPPADARHTGTKGPAGHTRERDTAAEVAGPPAPITPETLRPGAAAERNTNPA